LKRAVYTVLFGDKSEYTLKEPKIISNGWDHICFTDRTNLKSDIWTIKIVETKDDYNRQSRTIKILNEEYLPDYDMSIYIDSKFVIKTDLTAFSRVNMIKDFTVMRHNKRDCLFKEAQFILNSNIVSKKEKAIIKNQIIRYTKLRMYRGYGLWAPGIMLRKHGVNDLSKMMYDWHEEIMNYSYRDIISLPYVMCLNPGVSIGEMDFKLTYNLFSG
jgi:hypothetical protein